MSYLPNPEFYNTDHYKSEIAKLKNFIPNAGQTAPLRPGNVFVTVMHPGEEVIGVCDGFLITNCRVISPPQAEWPDVYPPRLPGVMTGLKRELLSRAHVYHLGKTILKDHPELMLSDNSGSDAT